MDNRFYLKLTKERLNVEEISKLVTRESCGAISIFVGTTRDNFEDKKVVSLEYEAYETMALKEMQQICTELTCKFPAVVSVAIFHRLGEVPVSEASVVIAVSSPHRQDSLEAVSFAINDLKKRVPIWKREQYLDENSAWKENKEWTKTKTNSNKLDFRNCELESPDELTDSNSYVQIGVQEAELERRIESFVQKKRVENSLNNLIDYFGAVDTGSSCARTKGVLIKRNNSKCMLKVRSVKNELGPQVLTTYKHALDNHMKTEKVPCSVNVNGQVDARLSNEIGCEPLHERLSNIEDYLQLPHPSSSDLYKRIKHIEERVLLLESLSPEYKHFLTKEGTGKSSTDSRVKHNERRKRKIYDIAELDDIIERAQRDSKASKEEIKET